jgi:hypothetical protein
VRRIYSIKEQSKETVKIKEDLKKEKIELQNLFKQKEDVWQKTRKNAEAEAKLKARRDSLKGKAGSLPK